MYIIDLFLSLHRHFILFQHVSSHKQDFYSKFHQFRFYRVLTVKLLFLLMFSVQIFVVSSQIDTGAHFNVDSYVVFYLKNRMCMNFLRQISTLPHLSNADVNSEKVYKTKIVHFFSFIRTNFIRTAKLRFRKKQ